MTRCILSASSFDRKSSYYLAHPISHGGGSTRSATSPFGHAGNLLFQPVPTRYEHTSLIRLRNLTFAKSRRRSLRQQDRRPPAMIDRWASTTAIHFLKSG